MKRAKFLRFFSLFDCKNEISNSSYILNINYNINEENFAKVHSTSSLRKFREGFICLFEKWDSLLLKKTTTHQLCLVATFLISNV